VATPQTPYLSRATHSDETPAGNNGMRIGILIVAYNAVTTLAQVLKRIPPPVWENVEEVVVFDDASGDATYELAVGYRMINDSQKLQIIKHGKNLGYGGNQKAGYKYFIDKGFDVVVLLHGDGQYAPEILHHLYHPIVAGQADAVFGSRMMPQYGGALKGGMPLYKYVGNRILSAFENRALGMNLTEFHSGYRAYNLRALRKIAIDDMTNDFHFDTEIIIKLHHQGFRIAEVPIPTYYGNEICYVNGMKYAADVFRAIKRYRSTIRSARRYPEFAEYFINYPLKDNKYSSHGIAQRMIGSNQRVLDLGCGEGFLAAAVGKDGNDVSGIDVIPAPRRRDAFNSYTCGDLNCGLSQFRLSAGSFDRILMLDVLQQLANPEALLREAAPLLAANGKIIVSLPNVANITVRSAMALGRFSYGERGILDRRHLRFYTLKTAREMLARCGYRIAAARPTIIPLELVFDLPPNGMAMRILNAALGTLTAVFPRLLAYQWVFEAQAVAADHAAG
jgi:glycosyltransferase involved in cell wall biosynthesis